MIDVRPTLEAFREQAAGGGVVPVVAEVLADTLTPVEAYGAVGGGEGSFLLESVVGGEKWARYSFVGFSPELIVRGIEDRFERVTPDGAVESEQVEDPWDRLRQVLAGYRPAAGADLDALPRFWGGAVGYVSYDAVRRFEPTVGQDNPHVPDNYDFVFAIGGTLLVFDNLRQTLSVVVPARVGSAQQGGADVEQAYRAATARIDDALDRLGQPVRLSRMPPPRRDLAVSVPPSSFSRDDFLAAVERCKEYIRAGDIFQVVLSQRFSVPLGDVDTFDVYRAMRAINPSPYMYFLRFEHARIAGASPETLVRVEDGVAEVRPIAGTRPRGSTPEEDRAIERELFDDPKEIAEHVMLVDLGRNDLGRISVPGSVELTERMVAERYSHVMHITSNVRGRLAPGRDALDVLRATFPAGTLSGAPKVRAMQIIEELEPERRGIYGGAVGYVGFDGNMDVAIAIRTVVEHEGELRVQAGAGIVEASRPEAEYDETVNKARAALLSLEVARQAEGPK
jgi:anthranilate synthase component 1